MTNISTNVAGATTPAAGDTSTGNDTTKGASGATGTMSTGTSNRNSNNVNRRGRGRFQGSTSNGSANSFKGAIPTIHTLATKVEKGGTKFATFIKSLHQDMITALPNPKDTAVAITEFTDLLTWCQHYPHETQFDRNLECIQNNQQQMD